MLSGRSSITWIGEFRDRTREQVFLDASVPRMLGTARLCVIATTLTSLGFLPFDLMLLQGTQLMLFLGDRFLIALIGLAAVIALRRSRTSHQSIVITYVQQYAFLTLNALIFNHPALERHGGILLPLMTIALLICLPGRFRAAALAAAYAPTISLLFWGVLRPDPETPADLAIIIMMTTVAYIAGWVTRSQFSRLQREEYLQIERERQSNQILMEARDAAEAGARAKAEFLAVMSHEIRTPMNGVLGMVRLVLDSPLPADDRKRLEAACQSAEGLLTILDDALDFSRLDAGEVVPESTPFALRPVIQAVADLMEIRARDKGLTLSTEFAATLPGWINGDAARLRQILFNLLGNAVKFTPSGGVSLRIRPAASPLAPPDLIPRTPGQDLILIITITDTGIGIPEDQKERIFQAFSQADTSISRRFGGAGLGLAISKRLVERMGGTIAVDSTPGAGSRFTVTLPVTIADAQAALQDTPGAGDRFHAALTPVSLPALSLLVVEDDPVNSQVTAEFLQRAGHRVTAVSSGTEALVTASRDHYDAILMDMQMPDLDGTEATRRIRRLPSPFGAVPIIALTANAMRSDIARCEMAGMNGHIAKPFTRSSLFGTLASVLQGGAPSRPPRPQFHCLPPPCPDRGLDVLLRVTQDNPADWANALQRHGHRLFPARDTQAALSMLASRSFDVILFVGPASADIPAPILRQLRAVNDSHPTPGKLVIIPDGDDDAAYFRMAGADLVVAADLPPSSLAEVIDGLCCPQLGDDEPLDAVLDGSQIARLHRLMLDGLHDLALRLDGETVDRDSLRHIAHRLKGSAANMRYKSAAGTASALEQALDYSADDADLRILRDRLRTTLSSLIADVEQTLLPIEAELASPSSPAASAKLTERQSGP